MALSLQTSLYRYDEIISEEQPDEPFDPPVEELYPEDMRMVAKQLDFDNSCPTNHSAHAPFCISISGASDSHSHFHPSSSPVSSPPRDGTSIAEENEEEKAADRKRKIKQKINKAKSKFKEKEKVIKKDRKEEVKMKQMVRNRQSAQRSRDRKREEIVILREENEKLLERSKQLEQQCEESRQELQLVERVVDSLSSSSKAEFNETKHRLQCGEGEKRRRRLNAGVLIATALIGCLGIVACLSPILYFWEDGVTTSPTTRLLATVPSNALPGSDSGYANSHLNLRCRRGYSRRNLRQLSAQREAYGESHQLETYYAEKTTQTPCSEFETESMESPTAMFDEVQEFDDQPRKLNVDHIYSIPIPRQSTPIEDCGTDDPHLILEITLKDRNIKMHSKTCRVMVPEVPISPAEARDYSILRIGCKSVEMHQDLTPIPAYSPN